MPRARRPRSLRKRHVTTLRGQRICTVDAFGVRDRAEADEEFSNFATHEDFPALIPAGEVWVDARLFAAEGAFSIANALAQRRARDEGADDDRAYEAGVEAERALRARVVGERYRDGRPHRRVPARVYAGRYATLPDPLDGPISVRLVRGEVVRSLYRTDYVEGGHHRVYQWVAPGEIWVEADLARAEVPFIVAHEYTEFRLMRDEGMAYDPAHEVAARVEYALREGDPLLRLLAPRPRRLRKADLPRLTTPDYFAAVRRQYLRR